MINPISFLEYGRITDQLMYFDKYTTLNFTVNMVRKSKDDRVFYNHNEYIYYNEKMNQNMISIKRNIDCAFTISNNQEGIFVSIRPSDMYMIQLALKNMILPWFIGGTRIFKVDNNNGIILKGKYTPVEIPLSEYSYIKFVPIIYNYMDESVKEGIRMYINSDDTYVDYDINKFMEFFYYMMNTDMYNAAQNMIQYIKTQPYGTNLKDLNSKKEDDDSKKVKNFFA